MVAAPFTVLMLAAAAPGAAAQVKGGIDVLEASNFKAISGKKVCLITNQTGVDKSGRADVDVFAQAKAVTLACLFSPEHGFSGGSEETKIEDGQLLVGGRKIPVYSLYKGGMAGMKPQSAQLDGVDALVFDIQDIGARFYTYLATMAMGMEAAKDKGIDFFVLDRPNPITGDIVEGPILEDFATYRKSVPTGYFPVSVRHGMTAGEIAKMYAAELRYKRLHVVKLQGWSRGLWLDETGLPGWDGDKTRRPSPNIPDLNSATLYPGLGIFETSNLSVGRGFEGSQFQIIGAPWLDAAQIVSILKSSPQAGADFISEDFTPGGNKDYPYFGQVCHGVRVKIADRKQLRPLDVFVALARAIRRAHPDGGPGSKLEWRGGGAAIMTGIRDFEALYRADPDLKEIQKRFDQGARDFKSYRAAFLLY